MRLDRRGALARLIPTVALVATLIFVIRHQTALPFLVLQSWPGRRADRLGQLVTLTSMQPEGLADLRQAASAARSTLVVAVEPDGSQDTIPSVFEEQAEVVALAVIPQTGQRVPLVT